jgi:small subunit ribosomal protein S20
MANTKSAEKAARQSLRKKLHNASWKKRIKSMAKSLTSVIQTAKGNTDILTKEYSSLQKVLDKAAKAKVIHKNKASRMKSRYAKKLTAQNTKLSAKKAK